MGKIRDKSQELVNNAIPHVLSAQQGAINLVHLKRNVETMTSSLDLQIARKAYVNTHILVSESVFAKSDYLQQKGSTILQDVNRLWKLRLQLDDLRATVNSSLNHMDSLMYLIYNEQPMLFPELDSHVSNYTDIYKQSGNIRDLKGQHEFYYRLMLERLSEDFDQSAFLREQIRLRKEKRNEEQSSGGNNNVTSNFSSFGDFSDSSPVSFSANTLAGTVAGDQYLNEDVAKQAQNVFRRSVDAELKAAQNNDNKQDTVNTSKSSPRRDVIQQNQENRQANALPNTIEEEPVQQPQISFDQKSNNVSNTFTVTNSKNINLDLLDQVDDDSIELEIENIQERHSDPIFFKSREQDLKLLALYKSELDRFYTLWSLFTKLQTVFVYETTNLSNEIDTLSHTFTTGETAILHGELSDISHLAAQIKPMVMLTVGFSLVSFWIVIFLLNRYIIKPLKNIASILIVFRRTKRIDLKKHESFFDQDHVMEIREIIDVLPQLFDEFSNIEKKSTDLKIRYKQLLETSKYDSLTKVLNRGTLNLLVKTMGSNTPANFAVLMVDIDHFKSLNDSMGHQRGDEVLFAVAQTLQGNLAKKDFVFRYGGEEFCVVLSDISPENAFKVAERLCNTIRKLALINNGVPSGLVTVSIGISLVTKSSNQFRVDELISQADKALYLAKRNGRNQVVACPRAMVFGMSEDGGSSNTDGSANDNDNPNLAEEATPKRSSDFEQGSSTNADNGSSNVQDDLSVSKVIGLNDLESNEPKQEGQDNPDGPVEQECHEGQNGIVARGQEVHNAQDTESQEDQLAVKSGAVKEGNLSKEKTDHDTKASSQQEEQVVSSQDQSSVKDGTDEHPNKSTSEVILEALGGSVEELDGSDPFTQQLPETYHAVAIEESTDKDSKQADESHDVTLAKSQSEVSKPQDGMPISPSMSDTDNIEKSVLDDRQNANIQAEAPQKKQALAQDSISNAGEQDIASVDKAPSQSALDNTKDAKLDVATIIDASLTDSTEHEHQEYELVIKTDESGNIHEYFFGEQDGPIDLTAEANKNKSGKARESSKRSTSSKENENSNDGDGNGPTPRQGQCLDAKQEKDSIANTGSRRSTSPQGLLGEVISIIKPLRRDKSNIVLTQDQSDSEVVIDQKLVAAIAATHPDQGITEDPFDNGRSIQDLGDCNVPVLFDSDFFYSNNEQGENKAKAPDQGLPTPTDQNLINGRIKYETAGSHFFLKNDVQSFARAESELSQWSLASLFKKKAKPNKIDKD